MKRINIKHINKSLIQCRGFTLIDVMVSIVIIGVLASIAIPTYRNYILKARAAEVIVLQKVMKDYFYEQYSISGDFPFEVNGSKAWTASRVTRGKHKKVHISEHIIDLSNSRTVDYYWYDNDPRRGRNKNKAWIAISVNKELFPQCGKGRNCAIHLGIKRSDKTGELHEFCGRWSKSRHWGKFPLSVLPKNCRTECVSCEMKKIK